MSGLSSVLICRAFVLFIAIHGGLHRRIAGMYLALFADIF
jgi:hypothetical protein